MRPALRRLFVLALTSDALAQCHDDGWETRCLHCRGRLRVRADGEALGNATLEHVVPQAWFGKRAAAELTASVGENPNDARNLALACAKCNHGKGMSHDAHGPNNERARAVVGKLLLNRLARWREPGTSNN